MTYEVTLHRASRIDEAIKQAIKEIEAPRTNSVSVYANVNQVVSEISDRTLQNIERLETLMDIRGRLRDAVGQKNAEVGINHYLARKHALDQRIQLLNEHVKTSKNRLIGMDARALEQHDAIEQIPARRQRLENSDAPIEEEVPVETLRPEVREKLADKVLELRRELEGITEKLRELNNTRTIEVADEDMEVLQRERIV